MQSKPSTITHHSGFTLTELMVTLSIVAILAALAVPSMGQFSVRNRLTSIGNEFAGSVLRTRNEAIGKNTCATMCMSSTVDSTGIGSAGPKCTTSGQNWQIGWIAFLNPTCDSTLNFPGAAEDMILVRRITNSDYYLNAQSSTRKIFINSRGNSRLSDADEFDLVYRAVNDKMTLNYGFNICLDSLGRTRTISTGSSC